MSQKKCFDSNKTHFCKSRLCLPPLHTAAAEPLSRAVSGAVSHVLRHSHTHSPSLSSRWSKPLWARWSCIKHCHCICFPHITASLCCSALSSSLCNKEAVAGCVFCQRKKEKTHSATMNVLNRGYCTVALCHSVHLFLPCAHTC